MQLARNDFVQPDSFHQVKSIPMTIAWQWVQGTVEHFEWDQVQSGPQMHTERCVETLGARVIFTWRHNAMMAESRAILLTAALSRAKCEIGCV